MQLRTEPKPCAIPAGTRTEPAPLRRNTLATGLAIALAAAASTAVAGDANVHGTGPTVIVTNCNDAGPGSLREAVSNPVDDSTIDLTGLSCSLISLTTGAIHVNGDDIIIQGPGADLLSIDGNNLDRVLRTDYAYRRRGIATSTLTVNSVTITQGTSAISGGCIFSVGNLALGSTVVTGCSAGDSTAPFALGGGVDVSGDLFVFGGRISDNAVEAQGPTDGGGAHVSGVANVKYSVIADNHALSSSGNVSGGGIEADAIYINAGSRILDNTAETTSGIAIGGGLRSETGAVTVSGSTISGNSAHSTTNKSVGGTVAFNRSSGSAGGISVGLDNAGLLFSHLESSIVARNIAPSGADIASNPGEPVPFAIAGGNSLVMDVNGVFTPGDTDTLDPELLRLANYGGSTATHALATCSPAIDAGGNPDMLSFDQRAEPYVRVYGTAADIGAFERQPDSDLIFRDGFESDPCP